MNLHEDEPAVQGSVQEAMDMKNAKKPIKFKAKLL